ncbi:MAG: DUF1190 family protein [Paraglaciecola sp.]|uniref:DUF1190 family protein n=1 Tax=Pseudomonadati TaxID=3379134 RepID=UPI00273EBD2B|nr:DUF1190 family protein [Paraglaciecola sp.]MDP5029524.1 DUF1190 family protein [Paraglaciecola sp.]MDP5040365.1 DUF1190 family protein [Paraglaciecola sp.]MDP5129263.1 DUF1190 family protein [Paraglaciecola sp.]
MPATLKRSKSINLSRMRKGFTVKPLALGIAAIFLSACGEEKQDATIYTNADECAQANPGMVEQCNTAYQDALVEAQRTGPKYASARDCEAEFGANQCQVVRQESGSFFMPFMAGYMLSNLLSPRGYYSQPMYTSYSPYSSYRNRWVGSDGYDFGDTRKRNMRVNKDAFKAKPAVSKTMSRGGFGSSVRAKSSWGSSSSKSSWGS